MANSLTVGLALGAVTIGLIIRIGLLTQPKTRTIWRSFFKRS